MDSNKKWIYLLVALIIAALGGIGYYAFGSKPNTIPKPKDPNDPMNQKIPGVDPNSAGAKAVGVLTDPGFFDGIKNLANTFYGIAKDAKANKQTGTPAFNTTSYGPATQQQAQSGATWGGVPYAV